MTGGLWATGIGTAPDDDAIAPIRQTQDAAAFLTAISIDLALSQDALVERAPPPSRAATL